MEKFILDAGKVLARIRSSINYFVEDKLQGNPSHIIYFLMALFILYILQIDVNKFNLSGIKIPKK